MTYLDDHRPQRTLYSFHVLFEVHRHELKHEIDPVLLVEDVHKAVQEWRLEWCQESL